MSDTFNALTGDLYALYITAEGTSYVDALYWISADGNEAYYLIGREVYTTEGDRFSSHELYIVPDHAKKEVVRTMIYLEGNSPKDFFEQLTLPDLIAIAEETA